MQALVRLGQAERAGQLLAGLSDQDRDHAETRLATAELQLSQGDPRAARAALAPVLNGPTPPYWHTRLAQAYLLQATAQDTLGDAAAAETALERALDVFESGRLIPFLVYPVPGLLERHVGHHTTHASLIAEIRSLLAGTTPAAPPAAPKPLAEPLSGSEIRVLRTTCATRYGDERQLRSLTGTHRPATWADVSQAGR